MGISIATYLMQIAGGEIPLVIQLFAYHTESILAGQFWRVLTPIFLHFGFLHIFFNMWWMLDLGRTLENYHSSRFLLTFTLASGIGSNLFQALLESNTLFGGMSGVVYALLGYIWMKARFQPGSGLYIPPFIVTLMLVWLALGFSMQNIANGAHAGGLLIGTLWGYLSATKATGR